jgi:hypothetical protein
MGVDFFGTDHHRPHPRFPEFPARVYLDDDDVRNFGLNAGNAALLWPLLDLPFEDGHVPPAGEVSIADARRALMRARATFEREAPKHVRPTEIEHSAPRVREDGTVELRPLRAYWFGLDEEGLIGRLERFRQFVEAIAERGATHVAWG